MGQRLYVITIVGAETSAVVLGCAAATAFARPVLRSRV